MNNTINAAAITFSLDGAGGIPIYRQIIQQIENAILSGRIKSGDKLPTIRALSVELKINPNTIARAYNELEIRGVVATQVGSGTFIADISSKTPDTVEAMKKQRVRDVIARFMQELKDLGVEKGEALEMIRASEN